MRREKIGDGRRYLNPLVAETLMASNPLSSWRFTLSCAIVLVVSAADFCTFNINPAIGYVLVVILWTQASRKAMWPLTAMLVVLVYAGYVLGPWPPSAQNDWHHLIDNYRMINRTMVALVVIVATMIRPHEIAEASLEAESGEEFFRTLAGC